MIRVLGYVVTRALALRFKDEAPKDAAHLIKGYAELWGEEALREYIKLRPQANTEG